MTDCLIVTDCVMSAQSSFPHARITGDLADVVKLPKGAAVRIHEVSIGAVKNGPCYAARAMIENHWLLEVEA